MGVQTSREHYCTASDDHDPYSAAEVGYPSELGELLTPYVDGTDTAGMRSTLYTNVPATIVHEVITAHGNIVSGQLSSLNILYR